MFNQAIDILFFALYHAIQGVIWIGEWTQRILFSPAIFILWAYKKFTSFKFEHLLTKVDITVIRSTEGYTPLLDDAVDPVALTVSSISDWMRETTKKSISTSWIEIKAFCRVNWEIISRISRFSYLYIQKTPYVCWLIAKETYNALRHIVHSIIATIVGIYTFLTSTYFKFFIYGFFACLVAVFIQQAYLFIGDLPNPRTIGKVNFAQSTHLYDRHGKLLYEIYRDVNRTPIKLSRLPSYVTQATISIEDKHYYNHRGISFFGGILRAVKDTLQTNELQGGSTITQQLVKTALLSPDRTVERKVKEIILALWTEQIYSKDQILEMYLNQVPYGGSSYGIEEAAKIYLGKNAKDLNLPEAALLAGLPRAPSIYSPFVDKELALKRRNEVLYQMYSEGYISKLERNVASTTDLNIKPIENNIRAPHFVFYTKNFLETEYGSKQVEEGGFNVTTSLDLEIQQRSEQILKEELAKIKNLNVSNGGILVLKPETGEILAMVGSVDYYLGDYGAFNVTTALRQPGSTLKPMLYALALQRGFTAASTVDDSPIIFQVPGGEAYVPVNYDGNYHGKVTIRHALSNSYNVPAVKVLNMIGVQSFVDFARQMGIDTWQDTSRFGLSLSLGGGEVTLLDLAQVYDVFATGGYRVEPTPLRRVVDSKERVVTDLETKKERVLDDSIAFIITDILSDNAERRPTFGTNSALEIKDHKVAVKTGTTNDKKDNLTVGYTPEYLVAVWVGNNDNTPMNPYLTSGITGAAPIWNRVMTYLIKEKSKGLKFEKPDSVVSRPCGGKMEYFTQGTETNSSCYDSMIKPQQAKNN